ncbi:MAG TPA: hypothetical protein V6D22_21715 [Candidatus Obscuribacterales bacterium]
MKNRRSIIGKLITKLVLWAAQRMFGLHPVFGPIVKVAAFVLA